MAMRVVGDSEAVDEDQAVVALDDADEGSEARIQFRVWDFGVCALRFTHVGGRI
jgi:hypothetical protein